MPLGPEESQGDSLASRSLGSLAQGPSLRPAASSAPPAGREPASRLHLEIPGTPPLPGMATSSQDPGEEGGSQGGGRCELRTCSSGSEVWGWPRPAGGAGRLEERDAAGPDPCHRAGDRVQRPAQPWTQAQGRRGLCPESWVRVLANMGGRGHQLRPPAAANPKQHQAGGLQGPSSAIVPVGFA